ncbi:hypothetical protein BGW42_005908 [Actinomortierella wolfii]|nr:hypothetical protein BGW42_005908 [Actinomortierella wolfii]
MATPSSRPPSPSQLPPQSEESQTLSANHLPPTTTTTTATTTTGNEVPEGSHSRQESTALLDSPGLPSRASSASPSQQGSLGEDISGTPISAGTAGHSSDSSDSTGSLGGLNHVNDGVGGKSITHRRMSRSYNNNVPTSIPTQSSDLRHGDGGGYGHGQYPSSASLYGGVDGLDSPGLVIVTSPRNSGANQQSPMSPRRMSRRSIGAGTLETGLEHPVVQESCWKRWLRRRVPIYGWLFSPGYNLQDLPDDLIAGITLSTVLVPQAMAYAMLAPLPPVYGLYTSVVPVLIYCTFGTSRHMHTGTFAITTLLLGQAVRQLMATSAVPSEDAHHGILQNLWSPDIFVSFSSATQMTTSAPFSPEDDLRFIGLILLLSFVVGTIQVTLSFVGAGQWASKHLLPDALVGGFNTAAVFHIGTSQLKHFLGITAVPAPQGAFALIKMWIWFGTHMWTQANWYTVGLGVAAITLMMVLRSWERRRKTRHEQELRRIEMKMVQERQALSEAISRIREEQRRQQELHQQQQQQQQQQHQQQQHHKNQLHPHRMSLYHTENPTSNAASNISLCTMTDTLTVPTSPGRTLPTSSSQRHIPSEAEQALTTTLNEADVASKLDDPAVVTPQRAIYIPIPDILLSVILLTVLNVLFSWDRPKSEGGFGIAVIGTIPKGLPQVVFPATLVAPGGVKEWMTWQFFQDVIVPMIRPALLIAFIIYVMSFSIAKQFGKRYGYKVDANQEMLALGLASMGGSCFSGYACTGSLTRTAILSQSGGKTPLASLVGVAVVMLTLVWLTWCFERVPNTVLAAIVLVALQSLISQVHEPVKLWKVEGRKADAIIWVVTFIGVWVISVEIGIFIGILAVVAVKVVQLVHHRWMDPNHPDHHGEDSDGQRRRRRRRRSSARRRSIVNPLLDNEELANEGDDEQDARRQNNGTAAAAASLPAQRPRRSSVLSRHARRRTPSSSVLDPGSSRARLGAASWKQRFLRTPWGQRIGSWFGVYPSPFLTDSIHTHTDEDDSY